MALRAFILFFSMTTTCLSQAEQRAFDYDKSATGYHFSYAWEDPLGQLQKMAFLLPSETLSDLPLSQPHYKPDIAQRHVVVELYKTARQISPRNAHIDVRTRGDDILIDVRSRSEKMTQDVKNRLNQAREAAFNAFLDAHYYTTFTTPMREQAVKPDHLRYIEESVMALIPLSQAVYEKIDEKSDARDYLNYLLAWVQSIPYDPIEDRTDTNGSGFAPPLALLTQNKGDCDSKSVLTAAATRAFLPSTSMILVLLREHALLGIALTPRSHETTVSVNNTRYVLFDPTGPALLPFGEVSESVRRELASGLYVTEVIK